MSPTHEIDLCSPSKADASHLANSNSMHDTMTYDDLMLCIKDKDKTLDSCIYNAVAKSPLFKLPRELRDMIYRLVLIYISPWSPYFHDIFITSDSGIPEPDLLSISKLIRFETYEIFYRENEFFCKVDHFDHSLISLAQRKALWTTARMGIGEPSVSIDFDCRQWDNLVLWLQACRRGECARWDADYVGSGDAEQRLLQGLFDMACGVSMSSDDLDWLLESFRTALTAIEKDWGTGYSCYCGP